MASRPVIPALLALGWLAACAASPDTAPLTSEVTPEGLHRVDTRRVARAWEKPDANIGAFHRMRLLPPYVAFRKGWERKQPRVHPRDIERIRSELSALFTEVFSGELEAAGYELVDANGPDVLVLRAAIIDLDVVAPDSGMRAGREDTISSSAASMTLVLELYDSVSGEILARAYDRRATGTGTIAHTRDPVRDKAEARQLLRHWARLMRERLDAHRAGTVGSSR